MQAHIKIAHIKICSYQYIVPIHKKEQSSCGNTIGVVLCNIRFKLIVGLGRSVQAHIKICSYQYIVPIPKKEQSIYPSMCKGLHLQTHHR